MNAYLWKDTPFEAFAAEIDSTRLHRVAYFIGAIELRVRDLFAGETPHEARDVARIMMHAVAGKVPEDKAEERISEIVATWRKRRSSH